MNKEKGDVMDLCRGLAVCFGVGEMFEMDMWRSYLRVLGWVGIWHLGDSAERVLSL